MVIPVTTSRPRRAALTPALAGCLLACCAPAPTTAPPDAPPDARDAPPGAVHVVGSDDRLHYISFACTQSDAATLTCQGGDAASTNVTRFRLEFAAAYATPAAGVVLRAGAEFRVTQFSTMRLDASEESYPPPLTGDLRITGGAPGRVEGVVQSGAGSRATFNAVGVRLP